jgi:K+-transporting ATPase KdpF subunit
LAVGQSLRSVVRHPMDIIIAGIVAVLLFFYLLYSLLKPERF